MKIQSLCMLEPGWAQLWQEINSVQSRGGWWSWGWREWSLLEGLMIHAWAVCEHHKIEERHVRARVTALGTSRDSKGGTATTVELLNMELMAKRTYTTDDSDFCVIDVPEFRVQQLVRKGEILPDARQIEVESPIIRRTWSWQESTTG